MSEYLNHLIGKRINIYEVVKNKKIYEWMPEDSPAEIGKQIPSLNFVSNKHGACCCFMIEFEYRHNMNCLKRIGTMIIKKINNA